MTALATVRVRSTKVYSYHLHCTYRQYKNTNIKGSSAKPPTASPKGRSPKCATFWLQLVAILLVSMTPHFLWETTCPHPYVGGPQLTDVCTASTGSGTLFLALINSLFVSNPKIGEPCDRIKTISQPAPIYDYVVVGAGAAGPTVASRLSEVHNWSVLLVEAGPDEPAGAEVPSNFGSYLGTELDWNYKTTNESYACLNTNGSCAWPRGRNLGGCTLHHGMAYHRGHPKDYDRWVELGNTDWGWKDVFPFFLKSEDNREIGRVSRKYHATGGPMTVERFPYQPPFTWDILKAADEAGFGVSEDLVGDEITGFTVAQTISTNGVRLSSVRAFVTPVARRKNLHVATNAVVTKISINKKNRATGIEMLMGGNVYKVAVKREVILSGGAINTPQLLLLSGIGPREHLTSKKIPVVVDLPGVGENLHNHQSYGVDFRLADRYHSELNSTTANRYIFDQTGPLSSTGLAQVTGVLASNFTTPDDPDIQLYFAGYRASCDNNSDTVKDQRHMTVRFTSVNLHPTSRGRVTLNSNDPLDKPIIWSNDLATEHDRSVVVQGIHVIEALSKTNAMRKRGLRNIDVIIPECDKHKRGSDDYWDCAIRWNTRPENHQAGTAKMGASSDHMAVVDSRLRVYGVQGLRVADSSIMPRMISGNPAAAITMIGERAADFIKGDWQDGGQ